MSFLASLQETGLLIAYTSSLTLRYEGQIRTLTDTHASERLELNFNLKVAREQLESLKSVSSSLST